MLRVFGSDTGERELTEVKRVLDSEWLGYGPASKEFERRFSERIGQDFILVNSCSNALYLAVKLLNLPKGAQVILPTWTHAACANAIILNGLEPVFCDIDPETLNATPETIQACTSKDTAAVMVVDYGGYPVNINGITRLGFPVIEDAACAVDSKYDRGQYCGTIADIGCYSFDSMKNLTMGEGGGLTSANKHIMERARYLRYSGFAESGLDRAGRTARWWDVEMREPSLRFLPSDVNAGIGLAQLSRLPQMQNKRRILAGVYNNELPWPDHVALPPSHMFHSWFTYPIQVDAEIRDDLAHFLLDQGIYTTMRYPPLHLMPAYGTALGHSGQAVGVAYKSLPVAERMANEVLNLPLHPGMSTDDAASVASAVWEFFKEAK